MLSTAKQSLSFIQGGLWNFALMAADTPLMLFRKHATPFKNP